MFDHVCTPEVTLHVIILNHMKSFKAINCMHQEVTMFATQVVLVMLLLQIMQTGFYFRSSYLTGKLCSVCLPSNRETCYSVTSCHTSVSIILVHAKLDRLYTLIQVTWFSCTRSNPFLSSIQRCHLV